MSDITETAPGGATETPQQTTPAAGEAAAAQVAALARTPLIKTDIRLSLALLLLCAGIYVPVMGSYGMFDPWETHYTEVARQFMVRNNWLETYWHNGRGPEGYSETTFWSKPVGSFWLSGLSLRLFGYDGSTPGEVIATTQIEWAVRLPFFLCGLFGIWCVYLMVSRLFSRRAGIMSGVVLATAPMYFQITRQAMTDIPYVALMSGGLALFALAVFGEREQLPLRKRKLLRWTVDVPHAASYYLFLLAFSAILGLMLFAIMRPLMHDPLPLKIGGRPVAKAVIMAVYIVGWALFVWMSRKTRTRNEVYLYWFYTAVAYAGLSKGLIGALQPGMVILLYLLVSREWRMLADVALARGLLVAVCVCFPWYHGMLLRFGGIGGSFWNEFFGTEQFRRATIGEQAQARGTFQYYVNQIAYGLYPWVAFLPAAVVRALGLGPGRSTGQDRARLFVLVWLAGVMAAFTLFVTKYHHYILPTLPPAAILVGVYLDDLLEGKTRGVWFSLLAALGVLAIVTFDLVKQPAHWVWMYTYLYDSNWARGVPGGTPILIFGIAIGVTLLLLFLPRVRKWSLAAMMAIGLVGGGYIQNWYQLKVAPHWSQKDCIATYYKLRKGPEEELVAWQFNWRGETWYTGADVVVAKSLDNTAIQKYLRERAGRKFFFITERSRWGSLRQMLPTERGRQSVRIVDDTNIHYVLASAEI